MALLRPHTLAYVYPFASRVARLTLLRLFRLPCLVSFAQNSLRRTFSTYLPRLPVLYHPLSFTLTPGDWDVSAAGELERHNATFTALFFYLQLSSISGRGSPTERAHGQNATEPNVGNAAPTFATLPHASHT